MFFNSLSSFFGFVLNLSCGVVELYFLTACFFEKNIEIDAACFLSFLTRFFCFEKSICFFKTSPCFYA